jgi:hypothetical protein
MKRRTGTDQRHRDTDAEAKRDTDEEAKRDRWRGEERQRKGKWRVRQMANTDRGQGQKGRGRWQR